MVRRHVAAAIGLAGAVGLLLCTAEGVDEMQVPQPSTAVGDAATDKTAAASAAAAASEPDVHTSAEQFEQLVAIMSTMDSLDLLRMGQVFFMNKVSELLMPEEIHADFGFHRSYWDAEQYTVHPVALSMLSTGPVVPQATFNPLFESRLREFGAVVVPEVFSREFCKELDAKIHQEIVEYPTYELGNIMEREFRLDYPLPMTDLYTEALTVAVRALYGGLAPIMGDNAVLVEFAALTSYPGSKRQNRHPDLGMNTPDDIHTKNRIVTVFCYLDDIHRDQAALDVWPGTHSHVHFLSRDETAMMTSVPSIRLAVPAGSFVAYDARTLHRGSENTSPRRRPTMYFSFMEQAEGKVTPEGPTYSARDEYREAKLTLKGIADGTAPIARFRETEEGLRARHLACQDLFRNKCCRGIKSLCRIDEEAKDRLQEYPPCQRCVTEFRKAGTEHQCQSMSARRFTDDGCVEGVELGPVFSFLTSGSAANSSSEDRATEGSPTEDHNDANDNRANVEL